MRQRASGTVNPEMKKNTYICSPRYFVFFSYYTNAKREYHDHAQADFDFGQVHVIWWLSYCQVEEKISVEPWKGSLGHMSICRNIIDCYQPYEDCIAVVYKPLTHWGRVTHTCVSKLTIIGSDNGLSPGRRQTIIWTNAGMLLIRTFGTNFSEILGEIHSFSFSKMHLKKSSAKWRLFGLGLSQLN